MASTPSLSDWANIATIVSGFTGLFSLVIGFLQLFDNSRQQSVPSQAPAEPPAESRPPTAQQGSDSNPPYELSTNQIQELDIVPPRLPAADDLEPGSPRAPFYDN
ncbi:uncharacterized protein TRUGW13939_11880 [Talaromyces rugulosus]|uniref:Uncharacterized protein n=1 Tax=Talaromyces rugulosus TaxID=121627 RepID=A0A7H8RE93_TALRU|nr:uncharacterized protein TRUGW13939_11880 [Talaromyces rugulosus]QKX64704.1 hypothetical protein TRUGW13939_11880 [Talaromyces rugulosus]